MPPDVSPSPQDSHPVGSTEIRVWDLPIRIFHWSLVALVATSIISGKIGGDAMDVHLKAGNAIIILLVFRLIWGIVGTTNARFMSFIHRISTVLAYCRDMFRGKAYSPHGHNPLGGWMVVIMLALLAIQAGTGLFASDDIDCEGPLASRYGKDISDILTAFHKLNFKVLAMFIGLHVAAIGFYLVVKRINLIRPMISGRSQGAPEHALAAVRVPVRTNVLAIALLVSVAAGFYWLVPYA